MVGKLNRSSLEEAKIVEMGGLLFRVIRIAEQSSDTALSEAASYWKEHLQELADSLSLDEEWLLEQMNPDSSSKIDDPKE